MFPASYDFGTVKYPSHPVLGVIIVHLRRMFIGSCKRLKIMKSSDAIGLGMLY